jgi:hypothetical protein
MNSDFPVRIRTMRSTPGYINCIQLDYITYQSIHLFNHEYLNTPKKLLKQQLISAWLIRFQ